MERYHKDIGFNLIDIQALHSRINRLNTIKFTFTRHSIDKITERGQLEVIGHFLRDLRLCYSDLFEYYKETDYISKLCFRINFSDTKDLILVLNEYKGIVTIYLNNKADKHFTLNKNNYSKV